MAVGPLGDLAFLPAEPSLADLPSESEPARQALDAAAAGRAAHVFWSDAAAAQPQPPPPPPGAARLKRSLAASPFAGAASKRPFRRRDADPVPEDPPAQREAEPPPAPALCPDEGGLTTENVRQRLPAIPTVVTTSSYMQISISPTVWRAQEPGCARGEGPLMLATGLQAVQLEGQHDLQLYLYSTMNPRVITTGIPQASGVGEAGEAGGGAPAGSEAGSDDGGGRTRHGAAFHGSGAAPAAPRRDRANLMLEEVFLVRKDPQRRIPDEVFHAAGPFAGGAALRMPAWPGGIWSFDICCRVSPPPGCEGGGPIWVKALNRPLQ